LDLAWNKPEHKPEVAAAIKDLLSVNTSLSYLAVPRVYKTIEIINKMKISKRLQKKDKKTVVKEDRQELIDIRSSFRTKLGMPAKPKPNKTNKPKNKTANMQQQKKPKLPVTLPVPATEMTLDICLHKIRGLKKRIREIEELEEMSKKGTRLNEAQIDKLQRKELLNNEIERLSEWSDDKLEVKRINKKLAQIEKLTKIKEEGGLLTEKELQKVSLKPVYLDQLSQLG